MKNKNIEVWTTPEYLLFYVYWYGKGEKRPWACFTDPCDLLLCICRDYQWGKLLTLWLKITKSVQPPPGILLKSFHLFYWNKMYVVWTKYVFHFYKMYLFCIKYSFYFWLWKQLYTFVCHSLSDLLTLSLTS